MGGFLYYLRKTQRRNWEFNIMVAFRGEQDFRFIGWTMVIVQGLAIKLPAALVGKWLLKKKLYHCSTE